MLKGISTLITPELAFVLDAMGHGDSLVIADANFPADELAKRDVVRLPGSSAVEVLSAVLQLIGPDVLHESPGYVMQPDPNDKAVKGEPGIFAEFERELAREGSHPSKKVGRYERQDFYRRASEAFAIVQTGESRLYGNLFLYKGVIVPKA